MTSKRSKKNPDLLYLEQKSSKGPYIAVYYIYKNLTLGILLAEIIVIETFIQII